MISKEEVERIAKLARLELTEKEIEKMQKDLSSILDYFELLKKAPKSSQRLASGLAPKSKNFKENFYSKANSLRKDEACPSGLANKLLEATPDKKESYVKVKAIL